MSKNLHNMLATLPESVYKEYTNWPTRNQGQTIMHGAAAGEGGYSYLYRYATRRGDPNIADDNGNVSIHESTVYAIDLEG